MFTVIANGWWGNVCVCVCRFSAGLLANLPCFDDLASNLGRISKHVAQASNQVHTPAQVDGRAPCYGKVWLHSPHFPRVKHTSGEALGGSDRIVDGTLLKVAATEVKALVEARRGLIAQR